MGFVFSKIFSGLVGST
jgi:ADP-ribosylation factor-like protein 1